MIITTSDLIGIPFKLGARGPETYDCYGLLRECYRRFGVSILDYQSPEAGPQISALMSGECARLWHPCEQRAGVTALIRVPFSLHVGFMCSEYQMIHAWEVSGGVLIEPIENWKQRVIGFYSHVAS